MCEHWLPLKITNVRLSFLLLMPHVKNTNWTLRFGAVASEPANLFSVALASGHKRKAAMDVKVFGLCLYPRFLSVCFNVGLGSIPCEVIFVREFEVAKHCDVSLVVFPRARGDDTKEKFTPPWRSEGSAVGLLLRGR
jgi:hypothetical protein